MTTMAVLSVRDLQKHFGAELARVAAVNGVDLDIAAGETVAIMGPSGCGKSTLLQMLGGLERPSSGEITLDGQRVDGGRRLEALIELDLADAELARARARLHRLQRCTAGS